MWLLLFALLHAAGCGRGDDARRETPAARPAAAGSPSQSQEMKWVAVRLLDGGDYFGQLVDVGSGLWALQPAYFLTEPPPDGGGSGRIRRFGNELHRPFAQIVFPIDAVLYEQPLDEDSPIVEAIREYEQTAPTTGTPQPAVPSGGMYAVVFRTGEVFFAKAGVTGNSVRLTSVHYLKMKGDDAVGATEIKTLDQLELVPQTSTSFGPIDQMTAPLSSVLYFQLLREDSPVSKALN